MSGGVRAAVEKVLEGQSDDQVIDQIALFDELTSEETGRLDAPSPLTGAIGAAPKRKRGPNRRTEAVTSWLLSQHRHPLSVMMEAYGMSPADLAKTIGLRKTQERDKDGNAVGEAHWSNDVLLDLFKLQVRMAEAVAPYVAQRQPQAVAVAATAGVNISFSGVSVPARAGPAENSEPVEALEGEFMGVSMVVKSDG